MAVAKDPGNDKNGSPFIHVPSNHNNTNEAPNPMKKECPNIAKPGAVKNVRAVSNRPRAKNNGMSKSKPFRQKGGGKKLESSIIEGFLLGKTMPRRARRCTPVRNGSLKVVKTEMKAEFVAKLQGPGKVRDKVRQWQNSISATDAADTTEEQRNKSNNYTARKGDNSQAIGAQSNEKSFGEENFVHKNRSEAQHNTSIPKRRIISDSHWMKRKQNTPPKPRDNLSKRSLEGNASNQPLEKMVQDWIKKVELQQVKDKEKCGSKKSVSLNFNTNNPDDAKEVSTSNSTSQILEKPDPSLKRNYDGENIKCLDLQFQIDDGIRVRPVIDQEAKSEQENSSKNFTNEANTKIIKNENKKFNRPGIKTLESFDSTPVDKVSSLCHNSSQRQSKSNEHILHTSKTNLGEFQTQSTQVANTFVDSHRSGEVTPVHESKLSPSHNRIPRNHKNQSGVSFESLNKVTHEINSAGTFDLPVGAEAGTLKRSSVRRKSSMTVPNILKFIYSESKRIVGDATEPRRDVLSQPNSIESWLRKTSDPFADSPGSQTTFVENSPSLTRNKISQKTNPAVIGVTKTHVIEVSNYSNQSPDTRQSVMQKPSRSLKSQSLDPSMSSHSKSEFPVHLRNHRVGTSSKPSLKDSISNITHEKSSMSKSSKSNSYDLEDLSQKSDSNLKALKQEPIKRYPVKNENSKNQEKSNLEFVSSDKKRSIINSQVSARQINSKNLSTICSETSSDNTSLDSKSVMTSAQTNSTEDTILTQSSHLISRFGNRKDCIENPEQNGGPSKNSDHSPMTSLRDSPVSKGQNRAKSAHNIRNDTKQNCIRSVDDVLIDLAENEFQYKRDLDTLVDGVIPVLLRCILLKSNTLFLGNSKTYVQCLTQPVIRMGNSLVKIQSHHKCIPLSDAYALLIWADSVRDIYEEYLHAWRSGFEDLVVNLAPGMSSVSSAMNEIKCDHNGDLLGEKGEKVVVADLLKKPITRIKYISQTLKSLNNFSSTHLHAKQVYSRYEALLTLRKNRIKEENARRVDQQACNADTSRVRNLKTLDRAGQVEINNLYQVIAKDCFLLEMLHSTGQRVNCNVELALRSHPERAHEGDLLIFKDDSRDSFLLFEPISSNLLSARLGDKEDQVIVIVNDSKLGQSNVEFLILDAESKDIAVDWVRMLGEEPNPSPIVKRRFQINSALESIVSKLHSDAKSNVEPLNDTEVDQVPIGEHTREELLGLIQTGRTNLLNSYLKEFRELPKDRSKRVNLIESETIDHKDDECVITDLSITNLNNMFHEHHNDLNPLDICTNHFSKFLNSSKTINSDMKQIDSPNDKIQSQRVFSQMEAKGRKLIPEKLGLDFHNDDAPPPPVHKIPVSEVLANSGDLTYRRRPRFISSSLKHEYQPSLSSNTFSESRTSINSCTSSIHGDNSADESDESDDEQLEKSKELDLHSEHLLPIVPFEVGIKKNKNSLPIPKFPVPLDLKERFEYPSEKFLAELYLWNGLAGKWIALNSETCLVLVTTGLIECFKTKSSMEATERKGTEHGKSILKQALTSDVQIRQSTAVDIEIRSDVSFAEDLTELVSPIEKNDTLRFRLLPSSECDKFYTSVNRSRLCNKAYSELGEREVIRNSECTSYNKRDAKIHRRYTFGLGRKISYRASAQVHRDSQGTGKSLSLASTALQRLSGAVGLFNISRSWIEYRPWDNESNYQTSFYHSNHTIQQRPCSQAGNSNSLYSSGSTVRNLGTSNIEFRLYYLIRNAHWLDQGQAYLTVSVPPLGMKQKAPLSYGPQKRITVTKTRIPISKEFATSIEIQNSGLVIDEVLGAYMFMKMQKSGIRLQIWEDISCDEDIGGVRSFGSVAPRRHTWALQFKRAGDAQWCWSLCRSGIP